MFLGRSTQGKSNLNTMKRTPLRRKSKTDLAKKKDKLWELCKQLTRKLHGHHCYTCGQYSEAPHTGHFITDSTCSTELSYSLDNLRPQCYRCNIHLSGNWTAFEERLIRDHGPDFVENLKKRNRDTKGLKYDVLWYDKKINDYQELFNNL